MGTNPFVMAASDPLSTFAADVDTASYDIFRRDINELGTLPQPLSVRLEEYVNYFDYDYEAPDADAEHPFAVSLEASPSPFVAGTTLVRVGIKGRALNPDDVKPMNLVFLIDTSGSMQSAAKLPLVKTVLTEAVELLQPTDRVSIVTYAGGTGVALPSTEAQDKTTITSAISLLSAGGSTAGAAGIQLAYEQAEAGFVEGGINHVILCTDGDFNVGASSDTALVSLIEEKRESGVTLTALGFGDGNLNDSMMEKVTNAGNGTYAVITDSDHAISYVHDQLASALHFIASDVKLQVVFDPERVAAYRQLGYEINAIADELFEDDTVDAGEIGAGHTVTALYEVVLVGDPIPQPEGAPEPQDGEAFEGEIDVMPEELVRAVVRYKAIDAEADAPAIELSKGLEAGDVHDDIDACDNDFQWAAAVAAFAEILKNSPYADETNIEAIDAIVAADPKTNFDREEFAHLYAEAKTHLGL